MLEIEAILDEEISWWDYQPHQWIRTKHRGSKCM